MNIGNVEIKGKAVLAPMAGLSDAVFRKICAEYGAAFTVSEMVSAKAVSLGDVKSRRLCDNFSTKTPFGIQLFGNCKDTILDAANKLLCYKPSFFDINMGCPAPKIVNNGSGSALMQSPKLVYDIVKNLTENIAVPITVKIRKGYCDQLVNAVEIAEITQQAGASAVTIHGRTRPQMYTPPVDIDIIAQVKSAVKIPVVGNGDIFSAQNALEMLQKTSCDAVMIGRGALQNPFIFEEINAILQGVTYKKRTLQEKMALMKRHIYELCEYKGEHTAMREARAHCGWYMHGLKGAASLRRNAAELTYYLDIEPFINNVFRQNKDLL